MPAGTRPYYIGTPCVSHANVGEQQRSSSLARAPSRRERGVRGAMATRRGAGGAERRELLFGARGPSAGGGLPPTPGGAALGATEVEALQARNGAHVDSLRDRVGDMRHLALDIGDEVSGQNRLLDGVGGTFDGAQEALGAVMRDLRRLTRSGAGGHLLALMAFMFCFFFLVYLLLR